MNAADAGIARSDSGPERAVRAQIDLVLRTLAGTATRADMDELSASIAAAMLPGFAGAFDAAHPPRTPQKWADLHRDVCVFRAFRAFGGSELEFKRLWDSFAARQFRCWRDDPAPPDRASPLEVELFHATKLCRGEPLGQTRLHEVLTAISARKRDADWPG